jgi:hypothetical protein
MNEYIQTAKESYTPIIKDLKSGLSKTGFTSFLYDLGSNPFSLKGLLTGTALVTAGYYGVTESIATGFAATLGFASILMNYRGTQFKNHNNILATASLGLILAIGQQTIDMAMSGDYGSYIPGMVMLGHAALTTAAFAIIPEAKTKFRKAVTLGGGAIGAVAAGWTAQHFGESSGFIPAATTAVNSYLFGIKSPQTARARFGYLAMNTGHLYYWLTQPTVAVALALTELSFLHGHSKTLVDNDVPMTKSPESDEILPKAQRLSRYWNEVIWNGKSSEDLGKTRSQLEIKSPIPTLSKMVDSGTIYAQATVQTLGLR